MSANEQQVGGTHYMSPIQHWDLVSLYGVPYLEGYASKYVVRWRKQAPEKGIQDLKKSRHITMKIIEMDRAGSTPARYRGLVTYIPESVIQEFFEVNDIRDDVDREILACQLMWRKAEDLEYAVALLDKLIAGS